MEPKGYPEAVVYPAAGQQAFDIERIAPTPALAEFVDYHWLVRWHVPGPHRQQVVPQPRVHLAAENGRLLVHGVNPRSFTRTLSGTGHVLGAAFHPGGFRPMLGADLAAICGTVQPGQDLLDVDDRTAAAKICAATRTAEMVSALEQYLLSIRAQPDPAARQATALVATVQHRADIIRAEQLAAQARVSLRTLQRLFTRYVGIGPKWVIQRFRILEAAQAAHSGEPVDWSALALRLGFSDQAHLTRVFTQVVGTAPASYQRDPRTT